MKRTTPSLLVLAVAAGSAAFSFAPRAHACGGVVSEQGTVSQDGQVSLIVLGDDQTDVFLSLSVQDNPSPFGVLIPVPSEPTIDPKPVDTDALSALDQATQPVIREQNIDDEGNVFSCLGGGATGGRFIPETAAVAPTSVTIGAVNATWLSGGDGQTAADWLTQQGFTLPDGGQTLLDSYVQNQGMSFLAIKRADDAQQQADAAAPAAVPVRVGVHFTLAGVHPAYALQMLKLGGADPIAVTVLVAKKDGGVGPDTPYKALTFAELDQAAIQSTGYFGAVKKGVEAVGGKAFVVEAVKKVDDLAVDPSTSLVPAGFTVTRLSTVLDVNNLDADVTFTSPAPTSLTNNAAAAAGFTFPSTPRGSGDGAMLLGFAALLVVLAKKRAFASAFA